MHSEFKQYFICNMYATFKIHYTVIPGETIKYISETVHYFLH